MCGIAGIISRNGEREIGSEMTRMLQSMKHRGPDSTGYALYGPPSEDWVMRVKLADANTPRDYEFTDRLRRNKAEIERRLATLGDALESLRADDVVRDALPGDMFTVFEHYKRDEWERFCATVTDWDVDEYLDILP